MSETVSADAPAPTQAKIGRTWADVAVSGGYVLAAILVLVGVGAVFYLLFDRIPVWLLVAVLMSFIWWPWLVARAKDDSRLILVADGPQRLTEYRVGRRVALDIEGHGIDFTSKSGSKRTLFTSLNPITLRGEGSALAGATAFDLARDLAVFDRVTRQLAEYLREERVTKEVIAIEVEKRVKDLSERWIGIAMATLEPDEIEAAMGMGDYIYEAPETVEEVLEE